VDVRGAERERGGEKGYFHVFATFSVCVLAAESENKLVVGWVGVRDGEVEGGDRGREMSRRAGKNGR